MKKFHLICSTFLASLILTACSTSETQETQGTNGQKHVSTNQKNSEEKVELFHESITPEGGLSDPLGVLEEKYGANGANDWKEQLRQLEESLSENPSEEAVSKFKNHTGIFNDGQINAFADCRYLIHSVSFRLYTSGEGVTRETIINEANNYIPTDSIQLDQFQDKENPLRYNCQLSK